MAPQLVQTSAPFTTHAPHTGHCDGVSWVLVRLRSPTGAPMVFRIQSVEAAEFGSCGADSIASGTSGDPRAGRRRPARTIASAMATTTATTRPMLAPRTSSIRAHLHSVHPRPFVSRARHARRDDQRGIVPTAQASPDCGACCPRDRPDADVGGKPCGRPSTGSSYSGPLSECGRE